MLPLQATVNEATAAAQARRGSSFMLEGLTCRERGRRWHVFNMPSVAEFGLKSRRQRSASSDECLGIRLRWEIRRPRTAPSLRRGEVRGPRREVVAEFVREPEFVIREVAVTLPERPAGRPGLDLHPSAKFSASEEALRGLDDLFVVDATGVAVVVPFGCEPDEDPKVALSLYSVAYTPNPAGAFVWRDTPGNNVGRLLSHQRPKRGLLVRHLDVKLAERLDKSVTRVLVETRHPRRKGSLSGTGGLSTRGITRFYP